MLTNNSIYTQVDLAHRLQTIGLDIQAEQIFTSAMATAYFMKSQKEKGNAFVIGEGGLNVAVHNAGYIMTDQKPDFVVLGETFDYNFRQVTKAVRLITGRRQFYRHQSRPGRPFRKRRCTGLRRDGRADRKSQRIFSFLLRKTKPIYDAFSAELPRRALRKHNHDR